MGSGLLVWHFEPKFLLRSRRSFARSQRRITLRRVGGLAGAAIRRRPDGPSPGFPGQLLSAGPAWALRIPEMGAWIRSDCGSFPHPQPTLDPGPSTFAPPNAA